MTVSFTPAAERALRAAADWRNPDVSDDFDGLGPTRVLLGLLHEDECRAAQMLAAHGIDTASVCSRWPVARRDAPADDGLLRLAPALLAALRAAGRQLSEPAQPQEYATEHLLLGVALAPSEISEWLAERGLSADEVAARIDGLYGVSHEPLPVEDLTVLPMEPMGAAVSAVATPSSAALAPSLSTGDRHAALRMIDAAANRAGEALRVIEDFARMALDDRRLTSQLKQLRHDLTAALACIPMAERLACRDTLHDVGTTVSTSAEIRRESLAHVLAAGFARLEQSLRTLEEIGKLLNPTLGPTVEALRYRAYTFHKALETTRNALTRLADVRLYVLLDGRSSPEAFETLARALIEAGVDALQLRDKRLSDRELLDRARRLRDCTRGTRTLMIVNDRPDLAALAAADGVHVGQEELQVIDVRRIVGPEMLIGVSTHSLEQARQAVLDGASYLGVGPVFPSATKRFEAYPGLELVRQIAAEIRLPALAIGGIGPENVSQIVAAGLHRAAVGGAICQAADPAKVVWRLAQQLRELP